MIQRLYAVERDIKDKPPNERYRVRQKESRPILDEMKIWLDQLQPIVPPKSLLGKAVTYALNQWPYVVRYLEDGLLSIDNTMPPSGRSNPSWSAGKTGSLPTASRGLTPAPSSTA